MFRRIIHRKNRALLAELVRTDFKLRYQGSVLGYAWSLLQPLFFFSILYFVFSYLKVSKGIPNYASYLLIGVVLWSFLREVSTQSLTSIVARGNLIRKIRIPRWIIILSSSIGGLINLAFNLVVVAIFIAINHVDLHISALWLILLILEVYVFALGCALFLSAAYVRYRDVSYIWDVLMQGGFYLTPIIYPIDKLPQTVQKVVMLNPMSQAIQDSRQAVVWKGTKTTTDIFAGGSLKYLPFAMVIVVFIGGLAYFRKRSRTFAEDI